jgi:tRNA(Ile2) C34 agmatinyltransferase TiaS
MLIGIDDTDSREGMCTTYLGALLMEELRQYGSIMELPCLFVSILQFLIKPEAMRAWG